MSKKKPSSKVVKTTDRPVDETFEFITPSLHALAVPIDSLTPDPRNARKHGDRNLASIRSSLTTFGQQRPISVDADGVILAGNGTYAVAKELGWTHIAVARSHLRGAEARAYAIADNRTAELATWDAQELTAQLDEIRDADIGIDLADLAFNEDEIDALLEDVAGVGEAEDDIGRPSRKAPREKPAKPEQWGIRIKLRDEEHQATVLDAIERRDGDALVKAIADCDVKPLVPLAGE